MQPRSGLGTAAGGDQRFAPPRHPRVASRARVSGAIEQAVRAHRLTFLGAPSGMGKSVAVSEWARGAQSTVAWLSLSRHDADARRLSSAVVQALQVAISSEESGQWGPLSTIDTDSRDPDALFHAVYDALDERDQPIVLVVDDIHRAQEAAAQSIIGGLLEQSPRCLRLVLIGREPGQLALDRLRLSGDAAVIGFETLRMTADDTMAAAAEFDQPLTLERSRQLAEAVDGWPAAVRLALVSGKTGRAGVRLVRPGDVPGLTDYVEDEVLATLPEGLRSFVLDATTVSVLDVGLAEALTGSPDALRLLEECAARGLFLDRFGEPGPDATYRWHSVFAARCRAVLERSDRAASRRLHLLAAASLASIDPLRAIDEYLAGGDAAAAVQTLREAWGVLLLGPNGDALERICSALPEPWASDPEVLMIRACALDVGGNRSDGQRMFGRVRAAARELQTPDRERIMRTADLATLFLADDHGELMESVRRVRADLERNAPQSALTHAAMLLMVGTTQVHIRVDMDNAVQVLRAADARAAEAGAVTIRQRALGLLAFTLAFRGDFAEAERALSRVDADDPREAHRDSWHRYIGGGANMAAAWMAYWRNDLASSRILCRRVIDSDPGPTSFAGIARHYLGMIAAAIGDSRERADAVELLAGIPRDGAHGVPWPAYRLVSLAAIAAAEGRTERAATIVRRFDHITNIPAAGVMLAEVARRVGAESEAARLLSQLRTTGRAPYVRASMLVTLALMRRAEGDAEEAHDLLERALDLAEPLNAARPFADDVPELRAMLHEHGAWGTRHTAFLAALSTPAKSSSPLSDREREIFGYLRTDLRISDIAAALGVSVNTVKTHTRMIYRKLGVSGRREAVRALR